MTATAMLDEIRAALVDGPKSSDELGVTPDDLRALAADGIVTIDPDPWPNEHVPGNPFIVRLPGDERPWPGWKRWNL